MENTFNAFPSQSALQENVFESVGFQLCWRPLLVLDAVFLKTYAK